ncbi:MAG: CopG family antitoxin [Verrucomicrobiales bacterium]
MKTILRWTDIPHFDDQREEATYWQQHQIEMRVMNQAIVKSDVRESTTITLRFDPRMLGRIKRLARTRFLNYQSMIKQWLSERLEQEMRNLP